MYWFVTSLPVTEDDSTVPVFATWAIAVSTRAAGTLIVNVPVVAPWVCEDRTKPPFACAIATIWPHFESNEPSGTDRATVPSRTIFVRSAVPWLDVGLPAAPPWSVAPGGAAPYATPGAGDGPMSALWLSPPGRVSSAGGPAALLAAVPPVFSCARAPIAKARTNSDAAAANQLFHRIVRRVGGVVFLVASRSA